MKKLFLIFVAAIILSGCSSVNPSAGNYQDQSINPQASTYNQNEVMNRIIDLRNGAKPMEKSTSNSSQSDTGQTPANPPSQSGQPAGGQTPPPMMLNNLTQDYNYAIIKTNFGDIKVGFYATESPLTVNNFLNLAQSGFYDNTKFHRVIKGFMIQGGDPNSKDNDWSDDGLGGPGYKFADELNSHKLVRGSLAMANSGPNTNGSQFFIVIQEATPWLDGKHTNFGYVISGMDIVDKVEALPVNENSHPTEDAVIKSIELVK